MFDQAQIIKIKFCTQMEIQRYLQGKSDFSLLLLNQIFGCSTKEIYKGVKKYSQKKLQAGKKELLQFDKKFLKITK